MAALLEAYITNLGKYAEGQLVGETLKFPATTEEVQSLLKNIGVDGVRYVFIGWVFLKLGTAYRYNACFFLCKFKQPDGKDWPWDFRGGSLSVVPQNEHFRLYPNSRGGCFSYDETPSISLVWGEKCAGGLKTGRAVVRDCENRVVLEKSVELNPARRVQLVTFPGLKKRGVF